MVNYIDHKLFMGKYVIHGGFVAIKKKSNTKSKTSIKNLENEYLYGNPIEAARHIDSLMKIIQHRYGSSKKEVANLGNFLITRAEVVFSSNISSVILEKRAESQNLIILAPNVLSSNEEERRIELLNTFGELILKFQKQAYLQIRDMLLQILDEDGKKILNDDLDSYLEEIEKIEEN